MEGGHYERFYFENSLNNLGIIGQARRLWLRVFSKDPRRATDGILAKTIDILGKEKLCQRPISEVIVEEELVDENSWEYIYKINNYRWGDAMYDWDLIHK